MKKRTLKLYFDESKTSRKKFPGDAVSNDGDLYIGGYINRLGIAGSGFDNFQLFNKALTTDEITILALANKDVMTD